MNQKFIGIFSAFFMIASCDSKDDTSLVTEGNIFDDQSLDDTCGTECAATQNAISGSGSIQSAFNGYILKSVTLNYAEHSEYNLVSLYAYDSNNRTITRSDTSGATGEDLIRYTMALTPAGLPGVVTYFEQDLTAVETSYYSSSGRLLSRRLRMDPDTLDQLIEYDYNNSGQPVTIRTMNPATRDVTSRFSYEYNDEGFLQAGEQFISNAGTVVDMQFQHDGAGRLSGFRSLVTVNQAINTSSTYTWDENNNIVQIDTFNELGELTRSLSYEYIKTDETVYNSILFDYIYAPAFR